MTDAPDHPSSDGPDLAVTEALEKAEENSSSSSDSDTAIGTSASARQVSGVASE